MSLAAGTRLDSYEIVAPLGAGGMGEVYRARDTVLKRDVAIKVLPDYWSRDPERLRRFELEAQAAAALTHPNIVSIHHVGRHDGSPYIVTELLHGETLRERLRHGPMRLREVIEDSVEIARGLAAAHDAGVIHRDLKPENIFITKDSRVKILDFGLAKLNPTKSATSEDPTVTQQPQSNPGHVLGTVGYMSPEQVRGQAADARSDIFAAGAVLYEMLTGKPAFRKATSAETMSAILNEDPPPVSQDALNLPPGLQKIVNRCLAKNPTQRFQHASDLAFALDALSDSNITSPSDMHRTARKMSRLQIVIGAVALALAFATALLAYLWMRPVPTPRTSNFVQLTHDGQPKALIATDGSRLYLRLGTSVSISIGAVPISGGEPTRIPAPSPGMYPLNLSPDGSQFLVTKFQVGPENRSLWSLPVLGGSPRRLGNTIGLDGAWSADGKLLAYTNDNDLFVAKADGTEPRKLFAVTSPSQVDGPAWSLDGTRLRFNVWQGWTKSLWEVAIDGSGLHQLIPGWRNPPDQCCGRWTADGKYFVFQSNGQIWALAQKHSLLRDDSKPIQLTSSPLALSTPVPGKDGKKLFVIGEAHRGELVRYDFKSGQFVPFLGGISAESLDFSKDGQWVAYVSYPEGTLWRSRADGSERLQLTFPSQLATMPRWSPDGKAIVFGYRTDGEKLDRIYEISSEGGTPRELLATDQDHRVSPDWSPDGRKIVFGGREDDPQSVIRILDFANGQVSTVPGSQGYFWPRWSPNGRYIVASGFGPHRLMLFDFQSQRWTELVGGGYFNAHWSKDGQYVYAVASIPTGGIFRIRISDLTLEQVVGLKDFVIAGFGAFALAPDDSPVMLRDTGSQNVYSLDWEAP